jgi:DNA-binding NtrC family response regulator
MSEHAEKIRILVVDDEKDYANTQCAWLRERGYEATGVLSLAEAERHLQEHAKEVDLALVDMYMEDRDSGLKLVELTEQRYPWIVSIIVTGYGDFHNAVACMEAGAFSYVMKGESPPELILQIIKKASQHLSGRLRIIPYLHTVRDTITELLQKIDDVEAVFARIEDELRPREGESAEDSDRDSESNDGE